MKKTLFIDLETSGLEPPIAVVLAIGAVCGDAEFEVLVKPNLVEWALASPEALQVNGLTLERLQTEGAEPPAAWNSFFNWLLDNGINDKTAIYAGQNPTFDLKFLQYYAGETLEFIGFPWQTVIDVRELYSEAIRRGLLHPVNKYRSGENISKALGIPPEPHPHAALEGARAARRNHDGLMKLLGDK